MSAEELRERYRRKDAKTQSIEEVARLDAEVIRARRGEALRLTRDQVRTWLMEDRGLKRLASSRFQRACEAAGASRVRLHSAEWGEAEHATLAFVTVDQAKKAQGRPVRGHLDEPPELPFVEVKPAPKDLAFALVARNASNPPLRNDLIPNSLMPPPQTHRGKRPKVPVTVPERPTLFEGPDGKVLVFGACWDSVAVRALRADSVEQRVSYVDWPDYIVTLKPVSRQVG